MSPTDTDIPDARPDTHPDTRTARREDQRATVLSAATRLLAREGRAGLSARKLAQEAGCSTKIIYSHFGGMPGVVAQLYAAAFADLADRMREAGTDLPPSERLRAMARAYRAFLLARPDRAALMYGTPITELAPRPDQRAAAISSLDLYVEAFAASGHDDPRRAAYAFWAATHGCVALELSGWLGGPDIFESVLARQL